MRGDLGFFHNTETDAGLSYLQSSTTAKKQKFLGGLSQGSQEMKGLITLNSSVQRAKGREQPSEVDQYLRDMTEISIPRPIQEIKHSVT